LVGRALFEHFSELVPLDISPPPADLAGRVPPSWGGRRVDIADRDAVKAFFAELARIFPDRRPAVAHLAALTDTKSERGDLFERVNVMGTRNLLEATREAGGAFIHISTDYVFGSEGRREGPYLETDRPAVPPPGAYAASKFRAENEVLNKTEDEPVWVARIAFPYGGAGTRPGLEGKMVTWLTAARENKKPLRLYNDQWICPSYTRDIARSLAALVNLWETGRPPAEKIFHLTGERTTPFAFAGWVREAFGLRDVVLEAVSVEGTPYPRNLWLDAGRARARLGHSPTPPPRALDEIRWRAAA
jgi:dTDP-4-dehydrorhamnose reductase